jgi:hypothetical protein
MFSGFRHEILQIREDEDSIRFMEVAEKTFLYVLNVILFVVLSIFFIPSFFIVTYLQPVWAKMLGDLFKL